MRREVVVLREMVIVGVCACRWIHASMVCVCVCVCVYSCMCVFNIRLYICTVYECMRIASCICICACALRTFGAVLSRCLQPTRAGAPNNAS